LELRQTRSEVRLRGLEQGGGVDGRQVGGARAALGGGERRAHEHHWNEEKCALHPSILARATCPLTTAEHGDTQGTLKKNSAVSAISAVETWGRYRQCGGIS